MWKLCAKDGMITYGKMQSIMILRRIPDLEKTRSKNTGTGFRVTFLAMLVLVVLGRGVSWFNTIAATDIAYAAWVSSALSYLAEFLVCARTVVGIAGITYAVYRFGTRTAVKFLGITAAAALLDYAARFVIDLVTDAITEMEVLAAYWLFLQFLFEMLFAAAAYFIACGMKTKFASTDIPRQAEKYTVNRSCMFSLLLVMLSRLVLEIWYLIDFLLAYTDITSTETASIVGSFLKVIFIYGGISVLLGEWYTEGLKKRYDVPQNVKND